MSKKHRVYTLFDIRRPRKDEYTGVTSYTLNTRRSNRISAARSGSRNEPVNEWINEIGPSNVGIRLVAECSSRNDAELIEQHRILRRTHVTVGGKNKRKK